MLKESMQGARMRAEAKEKRILPEQQDKETRYQADILNVKRLLDWIVYSLYKQICDNVADNLYQADMNSTITDCFTPIVPENFFLHDKFSEEFTKSGFSTDISLNQAKRLFDRKDTGIFEEFEFYRETNLPAILLAEISSSGRGFRILGYTDTYRYILTKAGSLVVNEIVRLGQIEGISIVPGVIFTLRERIKKKRAGEETFVKFQLGKASFRLSSGYSMDASLAFQYTYVK